MSNRARVILLVAVIAVSLTLRFTYYRQVSRQFVFSHQSLDAKYYDGWARRISAGDWKSAGPGTGAGVPSAAPSAFWMSPGYPYFLAVIYRAGFASPGHVAWVQFLLGIATCLMIYGLGSRLAGDGASPAPPASFGGGQPRIFARGAVVGLVAALLYGISGPVIFYEAAMLKASLINFLNTGFLFLLVFSSGRLPWVAASGLLLAFSVQMRPNAVLLALPAFLWLAWQGRTVPARAARREAKRPRRALLRIWAKPAALSACFALGLAIPSFLVAYRNYRVSGEWIFATSHGGINFYLGNNPDSPGPYFPPAFATGDPERERADYMREARLRAGRDLTDSDASRFWYRQAFEFIMTDPAAWLRLLARKAVIFWNSFEHPINLDYNFFRELFPSVISLPLPGWGFIAAFALVGVFTAAALSPPGALLAAYILIYFAASVVFFVVSEYRFPVYPVLCIFAALGMVRVVDSLRAAPRCWGPAAAALLFLWFFHMDIYSKWFGLVNYRRSVASHSYFMLGDSLRQTGRIDDAMQEYARSAELQCNLDALAALGEIYEGRRMYDMARWCYEQAIPTEPGGARARHLVALMEYRRGNRQRARAIWREVLAARPDFTKAREWLARSAGSTGSAP